MNTLPKLYTKDKKGKARVWKVVPAARADGTAQIKILHGEVGSLLTEVITHVAEGKHLGRSNETTPYEQAVLEATSLWYRKRDKGYSLIPSECKTNSLGLPMPMLAHTYKEGDLDAKQPVFVQPKLDGHRCLAGWVDGDVRLWSRGGKYITTLPHIVGALREILPKRDIWDGELYRHGVSLQVLTSWIRKEQEDSKLVQYHVYDCVREAPFGDRRRSLYGYGTCSVIKSLPGSPTTVEGAEAALPFYLDEGYEGVMMRLDNDTPYESSYRSKSLLKLKKFLENEWRVIDINKSPKGIPILVCDGFTVTAPGTAAEKENIYVNRLEYIGKAVTVKYARLTKEGKPFHPVALRFREDV